MILVLEPLEYAHKIAQQHTNGLLQELYKEFPELQQEMEYNLNRYGTPILHSVKGGLWAEDLANEVHSLMSSSYRPVEITIRPSDPDGHHYQMDWFVLTYDETRDELRRAIDVERERHSGKIK